MKRAALALAVWLALPAPSLLQAGDGVIDLAALPNYARQVIPSYIFADNTPLQSEGPGAVYNPITNTGATLGRLLFYDERLSRNNSVSCSSCHQQAFAFGHPDMAGIGVGGMTDRHPMRLINARFTSEPGFFWDDRAPTLESLVTQPLRSPIEMGFSGTNGDPDFAALLAKLSAVPEYQMLFSAAFGSPGIDEPRIQKALSQFIRSIQSFDSKFDAGIAVARGAGLTFPNFTASEERGKQLFFNPATAPGGGANCAVCHSPSAFANTSAGNNGVIAAIGGGTDLTVTSSPTLRDLLNSSGQLNGPMMHNGAFTSLAQVFNHYSAISGNPRLDGRLGGKGNFSGGQTLNLTQQDRLDLEAFLRTLSGKAVYTDPKWSNPFRPDGTITVIDTAPPASQTVNLSTRMQVLTEEKVGIGGFIITGTAPKRVLIRALGPSLAPFGLPTLLADPTLTLHGPAGFAPIVNDNWKSAQQIEIDATGLAPGDDLEPAIIATLAPGNYTAVLSGTALGTGQSTGTGTGILEIYDLNFGAASKLANISTRAYVGTGDNLVIAGFTVGNADSVDHIVVRGLGPTLSASGIFPALMDPILEVRNADGATLVNNDNWSQDSEHSEVTAAGLRPKFSQESAVALTLGPGAYTALLSPRPDQLFDRPGVGLIEVYSRGRVP